MLKIRDTRQTWIWKNPFDEYDDKRVKTSWENVKKMTCLQLLSIDKTINYHVIQREGILDVIYE